MVIGGLPATGVLRAADAGETTAMVNLGLLAHKEGDRGAARGWWLKAAEAGHADAMYDLGKLAKKDG